VYIINKTKQNKTKQNKTKHKMFKRVTICDQVQIHPRYLTNEVDTYIFNRLKQKFEGICCKIDIITDKKTNANEAYVHKIVEVLNKQINPKIYNSDYNANVVMIVTAIAEVFIPEKGAIMQCTIEADDTNMGVFVAFDENVFYSIKNRTSDVLKIGDVVKVKIYNFQLKQGDSLVNIVSEYIEKVKV
jgi:DNA-directed RNA polymerase subunit E'/Rpb7